MTMGPNEPAVLALRDRGQIQWFIECGTFKGATARWAAQNFRNVVTIEASDVYYNESKKELSVFDNVECLLGRTPDVLPSLIKKIGGPCLFWLDSHWCGMESYGENDQCTLLTELDILSSLKQP